MSREELEDCIYTYGKDLYSFCYSVTKNSQEADDLYQDTFLKLYDLGDNLFFLRNPKSFLMSVAVNLYRNHKRKLSVRQKIVGAETSVEEMLTEIPSGNEMVEDTVVKKEEQKMVRLAVMKLPDKFRIPVLLFYMEELPLADISEILKLPEGTVKSRIYRAKKILRKELEEMKYEK